MRCMIAVVAACVLSLVGGCDTLNVGGGFSPPWGSQITSFTVTPADSAGLFGNEEATFTVAFQNGRAPYTVNIDFGGAAAPNISGVPATSPYSTTVTLVDLAAAQSFTATARVTDATGITGNPITLTFSVGATRNIAPELTLSVAGSVVTASASDADGDEVTIRLDSATGGLSGTPSSVTGSGDFSFSAADIFTGGSGTATFTADDGNGGTDTETSATIVIGAIGPALDAIAAIPLVTSAGTADTVKVVVATGPVANPFQFMTGVSIVFPPGCGYSANSYDFGAPVAGDPRLNPVEDKDQETADGIWAVVNPASGFLGVGDNLLTPDTSLPAPFSGSSAIDFNITPLGGSDAPAGTSGILFNFNLEFSAPGSYKLDFLLFDEVNRTYYQDSTQAVYQWADISNSILQTTVTVQQS
ncbi:hypothetical protein IT575_04890 [bacterium]|nr:hypothetical protein [bacterium]